MRDREREMNTNTHTVGDTPLNGSPDISNDLITFNKQLVLNINKLCLHHTVDQTN